MRVALSNRDGDRKKECGSMGVLEQPEAGKHSTLNIVRERAAEEMSDNQADDRHAGGH